MKNGNPFISVRLAYPRMRTATHRHDHFAAPRVVIGFTALLLVILVLAESLFRAIPPPISPPAVETPWTLPFIALLAGIALIPGAFPHWWEKFYSWFSLSLASAAALGYMWHYGGAAAAEITTNLSLYLDFIILLGALFIITSGLLVRVEKSATPGFNVLVLLGAALFANIVGSMGASVLLARPFFRINRGRIRPFHLVFFVIIVANVGASLTALGDPPLLLGFLTGVPFWWITLHAWKVWILAMGLLLAMFYMLDRRQRGTLPVGMTTAAKSDSSPFIYIAGAEQLALLAVTLAALFLPSPWRDVIMVVAAAISLLICPAALRHENRFDFKPLREIGILFLAIFLTMTPVLNMLANQARSGNLRHWLNSPGKCFFTTGALSSVLDNAPTYLALMQARLAERPESHAAPATLRHRQHTGPTTLDAQQASPAASVPLALRQKLANPALALEVLAISLGSVFFGALTWIGNGPNLMIRAIAQQEGVVSPGFLRYLFRYALPCLGPVLVVVWLVFFWNH
ncbi:MAG: sodium:proton antiporter [Phycisphaerae bacterium]